VTAVWIKSSLNRNRAMVLSLGQVVDAAWWSHPPEFTTVSESAPASAISVPSTTEEQHENDDQQDDEHVLWLPRMSGAETRESAASAFASKPLGRLVECVGELADLSAGCGSRRRSQVRMRAVDAHATLVDLDTVDIATVCCKPHVELSALEPSECCVDSYVHAVTPQFRRSRLREPRFASAF